MIRYKMIYTINMHTTVYQFWRFVYHHEQSVIDHYARISLYTRSFCTGIKLYVGHFLWPLKNIALVYLQINQLIYIFLNFLGEIFSKPSSAFQGNNNNIITVRRHAASTDYFVRLRYYLIYVSIYLSIFLSIYLSIYLSFYLYICMSV